MLAKAGADITMPVMVDGAVGTAVDSAYYSFNQVTSKETLHAFHTNIIPKSCWAVETHCILMTAASSFIIFIL